MGVRRGASPTITMLDLRPREDLARERAGDMADKDGRASAELRTEKEVCIAGGATRGSRNGRPKLGVSDARTTKILVEAADRGRALAEMTIDGELDAETTVGPRGRKMITIAGGEAIVVTIMDGADLSHPVVGLTRRIGLVGLPGSGDPIRRSRRLWSWTWTSPA